MNLLFSSHFVSRSAATASRLGLCVALVMINACSYSDLRAPQAYPTNIIPTDSKFQACAEKCLKDYSDCTNRAGVDFAKDLQASPISVCRTEYKACILACRKAYNEIFN